MKKYITHANIKYDEYIQATLGKLPRVVSDHATCTVPQPQGRTLMLAVAREEGRGVGRAVRGSAAQRGLCIPLDALEAHLEPEHTRSRTGVRREEGASPEWPVSCQGRWGGRSDYGRAGLVSLWPHRELVGSQEVVAPVPSVLDRV